MTAEHICGTLHSYQQHVSLNNSDNVRQSDSTCPFDNQCKRELGPLQCLGQRPIHIAIALHYPCCRHSALLPIAEEMRGHIELHQSCHVIAGDCLPHVCSQGSLSYMTFLVNMVSEVIIMSCIPLKRMLEESAGSSIQLPQTRIGQWLVEALQDGQ